MLLIGLVIAASLCFNAIWFVMPFITANASGWFADIVFYSSIVLLGYTYGAVCVARAKDAFENYAFAWLGLIPIGNFVLMFWDPKVMPRYSGFTVIKDVTLILAAVSVISYGQHLKKYEVNPRLAQLNWEFIDAARAR